MIADMLREPINWLYFHFFSPIVSEFEKVSHEMIKELELFYNSLIGRVQNRETEAKLPISKVDFGAKFDFEIAALVCLHNQDRQMIRKIDEVKSRCHSMLLEAAQQVYKSLQRSQLSSPIPDFKPI